MRKSVLVIGIAILTLVGCKNGEQKDVTSEEIQETIDPTIIDEHNSQNSLDWAGVYEGTTPCASCVGIETVLELRSDDTFSISQRYIGKQPEGQSFDDAGSFTWDDTGSIITLEAQGSVIQFRVGENQVIMLDMAGNIISGELADFYVLKKKI